MAVVGVGRLHELVGDFGLRRAENDAGLPFTFGLRLPRHRVLKRRGDDDVANLHRLHLDPPRLHLLLERQLESVPELDARLDELRQIVLADRIPQRSLC